VVVFDTVRTQKLVVDDSSLGANAGAAEALAGKGNRFVIEDIDYAKVSSCSTLSTVFPCPRVHPVAAWQVNVSPSVLTS
jgi:hypothetical protein